MRRKKKWMRPKLIVIVKGRPEEYALVGCKAFGISGSESVLDGYCSKVVPNCGICSTKASS